jgi:DNA-binding beta-propeller fold protein YncE
MKPLAILIICFSVLRVGAQGQKTTPALKLIQTIPLPGVEGRIDHFDLDLKRQRLFVCALGNNTLEVLDLKAGKRIESVGGCSEPQGVVYVPGKNQIFVANGGAGRVNVLDGASFKVLKTLGDLPDADDARYDAKAGLIYVAYGDGGLAVIRAATAEKVGVIKTDGHPEAFELEPNGNKIFINVPDAQEIEVADRQRQNVVAKWPMNNFGGNFPMALDEEDHRLFVGCRSPARLLVFDTATGRLVADLPLSGDNDDLFYDAARRRIYASCGEGFVDVFSQSDANHYERIEHISTGRAARTSYFSRGLNELFLAVPRRWSHEAGIRVFQLR